MYSCSSLLECCSKPYHSCPFGHVLCRPVPSSVFCNDTYHVCHIHQPCCLLFQMLHQWLYLLLSQLLCQLRCRLQGALRVSRFNPFEGWVGSESVGQDILISGRVDMNRLGTMWIMPCQRQVAILQQQVTSSFVWALMQASPYALSQTCLFAHLPTHPHTHPPTHPPANPPSTQIPQSVN